MPLAQTWEYVCFLGRPSWQWHCGGFYVKRWDNAHAAHPAQAPAVQQMVYVLTQWVPFCGCSSCWVDLWALLELPALRPLRLLGSFMGTALRLLRPARRPGLQRALRVLSARPGTAATA